MTTFTGYRVAVPDTFALDVTDSWTGVNPRPPVLPGVYDFASDTGSFSDTLPISELAVSFSGGEFLCFFQDYYNRIWLFPQSLDLGPVGQDAIYTFNLWNAYLRQNNLNDTTVSGDDDGLLLGIEEYPLLFPGLKLQTVSLTASVDGPPEIDVTYSFDFALGPVKFLPVSGTRVRLWPFDVNWGEQYQVQYEYKTDIITSRSGREQRRAMRQTPRKTLEFSISLMGAAELRQFRQEMISWQQRTYTMPEWPRRVHTTAPLSSGGLSVAVDEVPAWLIPGRTVLLADGDERAVATVDTVAGSTVSLTAGVSRTWPAGTRIVSAVSGLLSGEIAAPRRTNTVATADVSFAVTPGWEPAESSGSAAETWQGREVFLLKPNWAEPVDASLAYPVEQVDFGVGRIGTFRPIQFQTETRRGTFLMKSNAEAESLRQFIDRMRGQQGEWWMPTWEYDIIPALPLYVTTDTLRVSGTDFQRDFKGATTLRAICVVLTNGTRIYRMIDSMDVVDDEIGTDSRVYLTEPWAETITLESIDKVCWMMLWRLSSDSATFDWLSDGVARIALTHQSLEVLP